MRWSHIPALVTPTWLVTSHGKLQSTNSWLLLRVVRVQHHDDPAYSIATACPSYSWPHHIHMIALLQQLLPICCSKWQFNPNSYQWHVMRCWVVTYIRYAISIEPTILVLSAYVARILLNNIQHPTYLPISEWSNNPLFYSLKAEANSQFHITMGTV